MSPKSGRERPLVLNFSKYGGNSWKWFDGQIDADFTHVYPAAGNFLERWIRRPPLSRYRAVLQAAWRSRSVDLIISHSPDITAWTELARRGLGARSPHLAFSFNFTRLPEGGLSKLMATAFRTVDRFVVFSTMERDLYSRTFGIPPERIEMIYWGVGAPSVTSLPTGVGPDFISAVGGEGRDYTTFLAAMTKLPHIRAEIVARPDSIGSARIPRNVTVRTNIPSGEANAIIRHSRFLVVPLLHSQVPCGHATIVSAMQLGKPIVYPSLVRGFVSKSRRNEGLTTIGTKYWRHMQESGLVPLQTVTPSGPSYSLSR